MAIPIEDIEYSVIRVGDRWSAAWLAGGEVIINCYGLTPLLAFETLAREQYRIGVQACADAEWLEHMRLYADSLREEFNWWIWWCS